MKYSSILFSLCFVSFLAAEQDVVQEIVVGAEQGWGALAALRGFVQHEGATEGLTVLSLKKASTGAPRDTSEFFLAFEKNETPSYPLVYDSSRRIGAPHARAGAQAAYFRGDDYIEAAIPPEGFLSPGMWEHFTVELWIYPLSLVEGSQLLYWEGWLGDVRQQLYAEIRQNRFVWQLRNLFVDESGSTHSYTLSGEKSLVPECWSRHVLRYRRGLLEYSANAIPQDLVYTTQSTREDTRRYVLSVGSTTDERFLRIGSSWVGLIDDFAIHTTYEDFDEVPSVAVEYEKGTVLTEAFDLGSHGGIVERVDVYGSQSPDDRRRIYYRLGAALASSVAEDAIDAQWRVLPASGILNEEGRYIQLRLELYGTPARSVPPSISSLRVFYRPFAALAPPQQIYAEAGDGAVLLEWPAVEDERIDGYRVYFGRHRNLLRGEAHLRSPIDVGLRTSTRVEGLTNGQGYFFAVAGYSLGIRSEESLSETVFVRPLPRP